MTVAENEKNPPAESDDEDLGASQEKTPEQEAAEGVKGGENIPPGGHTNVSVPGSSPA